MPPRATLDQRVSSLVCAHDEFNSHAHPNWTNTIEDGAGRNHTAPDNVAYPLAESPMKVPLEARPTPERGMATFVTRDVNPGELLGTLTGSRLTERTRYTIERDGRHHEPEGPLRYLNHSCAPTARWSGRDLRALRSLREGEEVTFDYTETESAFAAPFVCRCGGPHCRKVIGTPAA